MSKRRQHSAEFKARVALEAVQRLIRDENLGPLSRELKATLWKGKPDIFNTDQGAQFPCADFLDRLQRAGIRVSIDGRAGARWTTCSPIGFGGE